MRINGSINSRDGKGDCEITEEALLDAGTRINPNKADGIPGAVVKELVEKRTDKMLKVLNDVNNSGRIPALWKVARVVLIPKPGRDPALTSSFWQINVLPVLNKVWKHTSKNLIEEKLGLDPFHKDQYVRIVKEETRYVYWQRWTSRTRSTLSIGVRSWWRLKREGCSENY